MGNTEIPKIKTPTTFDTYNFLYRPSITVKSQAKL
jgi:hypothetical protein